MDFFPLAKPNKRWRRDRRRIMMNVRRAKTATQRVNRESWRRPAARALVHVSNSMFKIITQERRNAPAQRIEEAQHHIETRDARCARICSVMARMGIRLLWGTRPVGDGFVYICRMSTARYAHKV